MPFTITGDLALGSSLISNPSSTTSLAAGMLVDNANITAGTTIASVNSAPSSITLSGPATAAATGASISFVSSFAAAVAAAVTVTAPGLVVDGAMESSAFVSATSSCNLDRGESQILISDNSVIVTGSADLTTGRNDVLETSSAVMTVTVTADVSQGRYLLEADALVPVIIADLDLIDQRVPLATAGTATMVAATMDLELSARQLFDAIEIYLDVVTRQIVRFREGYAPAAAGKILLKRNDKPVIRVWFVRYDALFDIPDGTTVRFGGKRKNLYTGALVFDTGTMTRYVNDDRMSYYEDVLDLSVSTVSDLFPNEAPAMVACSGEIEVSTPSLSAVSSSMEFPIELWNDIVR
jgi:hypothetical protein